MAAGRMVKSQNRSRNQAPEDANHSLEIESLIIELINSIAENDPWISFLEMIKRYTGSSYATILVRPSERERPTLITTGSVPEDGARRYVETYFSQEALVGLREGEVRTLSDIMPQEQLHETGFYKEYLEPLNVGYVLGVDFGTIRGISAKLRVSRSQADTDYGPEDRHLFEQLTPYLRAALNLFVRRIDTEAERAALAATVAGMSVGNLMVDPDGHIIDANGPAMAILDQHDGVRLIGGRLALDDAEKSRYLHELIRKNAEASTTNRGIAFARALLVERPSGREGLSLLVQPAANAGNNLAIRPTALVHIVDPSEPRVTVHDALKQLFGLTPAEARIALSLSNGCTISEIARATSLSRNTIRTQLRSIFVKMGVKRQSALIRAVLISVALLSLQSRDGDQG